MKSKMRLQVSKAFSVIVSIAVLLVFFNNCGKFELQGTDTGNPGLQQPDQGSVISSNFAEDFSQVICAKIAECFDPSLMNCEVKLSHASSDFGSEFGIADPRYSELNGIQSAISRGELFEDRTASAACRTAIAGLRCDSDLVNSSYDSSSIENLANVAKILKASEDWVSNFE